MTEQVACRTCGVLFEPRASGGKPQVRCSAKCRDRAAIEASRARAFALRPLQCPECAGPITQPEHGRPRRFCSDSCKKRSTNRAQNRRRQPVGQHAERKCECGTQFNPSRSDQVYCAPKCGRNAGQRRRYRDEPLRQGVVFRFKCVECGSDFEAAKINAKWCSSACRIRTTGRDSSRRRGPKNLDDAPYTDREIFDRDGWRCHLCKKLVRKTANRNHPDGATIDHLVPRADGGADAPSNVATAHLRCNLAKGRKPMNEQLHLI